MPYHVKIRGERVRSSPPVVREAQDKELDWWDPQWTPADKCRRMVKAMLIGALSDLSKMQTYGEIQHARRLANGRTKLRYNKTRDVIKASDTPAGLAIDWILGPYCPSGAFSFGWTCDVLNLSDRRIKLIISMATEAALELQSRKP